MGRREKADSNALSQPRRDGSQRRGSAAAPDGPDAPGIPLENEVDRLTRELAESREQQTATADVLKVISQSSFDLQTVLDTLIESATRLCGAKRGHIFRLDGEHLRFAAACGAWPGFIEYLETHPVRVGPGSVSGRAALERRTIHVHDVRREPGYEYGELMKQQGYRTVLAVPMLRGDALLGVIMILKTNVEPFSDKQIELVTTFADQAVIAIENVRLFAEIQEKTRQVEAQAAELAEWNRTLETRVADQVEQLGRMSKLTRFLSPKVSHLIMAGEADDPLQTRRTEVTVVYVDLRGFTAFTETADPEEVMGVLREYHAELGKAITAYDGTIEHFAGDGAMILFNAPMPMDEHELQAIRMTLQIREAVGALALGWKKRGFDLGIGAGVAGGYATLGTIGFAERLDYSAIGNVCNLAARLCGEATDRQILISPRVFAKVEPFVEVLDVGALVLKGFHRPVAAHNVTGLRTAADQSA